jgi:hypothetical protein
VGGRVDERSCFLDNVEELVAVVVSELVEESVDSGVAESCILLSCEEASGTFFFRLRLCMEGGVRAMIKNEKRVGEKGKVMRLAPGPTFYLFSNSNPATTAVQWNAIDCFFIEG